MKANKKELLLTSLVCLLPLLAGVILYPRLPETMATHWGFDGTANGWSSRAATVFGLSLIHILLDGAKIGDDCIIAAGAVVTGKMDAPAGSLLVGSPAVVAKPLNDKQKASCLENSELYYRKSVEYRAFLAQQGK